MKKRIIVVVMIFIASVHAHAITIVDTGTNYGGQNGGLFGGISTGGQAYQWIAGKFTIDQNYFQLEQVFKLLLTFATD